MAAGVIDQNATMSHGGEEDQYSPEIQKLLAHGEKLVSTCHYEQGLKFYLRALEQLPDDADILEDVGTIYLELGDPEAAREVRRHCCFVPAARAAVARSSSLACHHAEMLRLSERCLILSESASPQVSGERSRLVHRCAT